MAYAEGLNILVVDPEESVVLEYKQLLGDAGHHVQATTEVALAVEEVKNGQVLHGLGHDRLVGCHHQQSQVDPSHAGQHIVDEALVTGDVNYAYFVAAGEL